MQVVLSALAAKAATTSSGLSLAQIMTALFVTEFPGQSEPLELGCIVAFGESERLTQSLITVDWIDPEGKQLARLLTYHAIIAGHLKDPHTMHVAMSVGRLPIPSPSDYELLTTIDGATLSRSSVRATLSQQPTRF